MKRWADDIRHHIDTWSSRLGNLNWWPRYVYHFTDVRNAASILDSGRLFCRTEALNQEVLLIDSASPGIIQSTRSQHLNYVRLYFRPRTPTQYRNEGIRPRNERTLDAHCPIPIYFCFDAMSVLSRDDTEFSNGNMASHRSQHSGTREFFNSLPFDLIYHNQQFPPDQRDEIVFRRNAEVLVPGSMNLQPELKLIGCRTVAERQTLMQLLSPKSRRKWEKLIRLPQGSFFERRWTFIEEVVVVDDVVNFRFNPSTITPGPFQVHFSYHENGSQQPRTWDGTINALNTNFRIRVSRAERGTVALYLDDSLAFCGPVVFEDIPF